MAQWLYDFVRFKLRPSKQTAIFTFKCMTFALIAGVIGVLNQYCVGEASVWGLDQIVPDWRNFKWVSNTPTAGIDIRWSNYIAASDLLFFVVCAGFWSYGLAALAIFFLRAGDVMTLLRAYLIIGLTGLLGGAIGGCIGALLGMALPNYYRGVFRGGEHTAFDPVQVGAGLGVTHGLPWGLAVGAFIVFVLTWYAVRTQSPKQLQPNDETP